MAWKDIPGWVGKYQISENGVVRSLPRAGARRDGHAFSVKGGILIPNETPLRKKHRREHCRAPQYTLSDKVRGGKHNTHTAGYLMLSAFTCPPPLGHVAQLKGGDAFKLENWEWVPSQEHAKKKRKLSVDQIRIIRSSKLRHCDLAREFCVHRSVIRLVHIGRTYRHVI